MALAAIALGAAGCGGDANGDGASSSSTPAVPDGLVVRELDGDRLAATRRLDCAAPGDACARVVALLPRLRPEPGEICTEIYGGPERIVVEGAGAGPPVRAEVTRVNGCEITRYDLLREAIGTP